MTPTYLGANGIGGMDVSGVTYKYTPIKNKEDDYIVTLENDKVGGGYVFQDKQDWSQREGGIEIRRTIALPYLPIAVFGDGRLKQEGSGSIEDADVRYIYRFDSCFDPQSNPNCPGYVKPKPPPFIIVVASAYFSTPTKPEPTPEPEISVILRTRGIKSGPMYITRPPWIVLVSVIREPEIILVVLGVLLLSKAIDKVIRSS